MKVRREREGREGGTESEGEKRMGERRKEDVKGQGRRREGSGGRSGYNLYAAG